MTDLRKAVEDAVSQIPVPDLQPYIQRSIDPEGSRAMVRTRMDTAEYRHRPLVIGVAFTIFAAAALFGWSVLSSGEQGNQQTAPRNGEAETPWFRLSYPDSWSIVTPSGTRVGEGILAAQVTSFPRNSPTCVGGEGDSLPSDGVLIRFTLGWEQPAEGALTTPAFEPTLGPEPEHIHPIGACGSSERRFGMFFGPDGQLMTVHALIAPDASANDIKPLAEIVTSLAPTGGPTRFEPGIETAFASGTSPEVGDWKMTLKNDVAGGTTVNFRTKEFGWGVDVDGSNEHVHPLLISVGADQVLVAGVLPNNAAEVTLAVETGEQIQGKLVSIPQEELPGWVGFWVPPFRAHLGGEGTRLTPGAVLIVRDVAGQEIERLRLP